MKVEGQHLRKKRVRIRTRDLSTKRNKLSLSQAILILLSAALTGILIGLMLGHLLSGL
ncbi:MAG: hypothetical protein U9N73_09720 [Candidatus Auribacterota bacterium]|nr:hypothetical protein [Candidatus Auribacterota bacterium]